LQFLSVWHTEKECEQEQVSSNEHSLTFLTYFARRAHNASIVRFSKLTHSHFFGISPYLTNHEDELDWVCEDRSCNSPIFINIKSTFQNDLTIRLK